MRRLFACAILFAAALLFIVQPLAGKLLLPVLGGSPAVWSTCLVFFQAVLLLGYLYAHALSTRVPRALAGPRACRRADRRKRVCCRCRCRSANQAAPIRGGGCCRCSPRTVGLPFFALSATAPLLQQWFSRTDDPGRQRPVLSLCREQRRQPAGTARVSARWNRSRRGRVQVVGWSAGFWALRGARGRMRLCERASAAAAREGRRRDRNHGAGRDPDLANARSGSCWRSCRLRCCWA